MSIVFRIVIISCLLTAACTRAKSDKAVVVFEVPAVAEVQKPALSLLAVNEMDLRWDDGSVLYDDWFEQTPTGFDGVGSYPINCYAVMVGGAEAEFNKNYCGASDENDEITTKLFSFGPWAGAVLATGTSTQLELELLAGTSRTFYLIGFHAQDPTVCVDFRKQNFDKIEMTKPMIIGEVTGVKLEAGATQTIRIPRQINYNRTFDDCKFNDDSEEGSDTVYSPKYIVMERAHFIEPGDDYITGDLDPGNPNENDCTPFTFRALDKHGRDVPVLAPTTVSVKSCVGTSMPKCYTGNEAQLAVAETYNSYENCIEENASGKAAHFVMPINTERATRWVRSPVKPSGNMNHHAFFRAESVGLQSIAPKEYKVRMKGSESIYRIEGSNKIFEDNCNTYKIESSMYGSIAADDIDFWEDPVVEKWNAANNTWSIQAAALFEASTCTGGPPVMPSVTFTEYKVVYLKVPEGKYRLRQPTQVGTGDDGVKYFKSFGRNSVPKNLAHVGPAITVEPGSAACSGPHKIKLVNARGVPVVSLRNRQINLGFNGTAVSFHATEGTCDSGTDPLNSVTLLQGERNVHFYIRSTTAGATHVHAQDQSNNNLSLQFMHEFVHGDF